eukprot:CAMPEP_0172498342 /NCGR_PEP_ID=MMETSP1066-20121228/112589_1 /TAXON_ID=671091 /ORGANISM="Coscinodiscus wailesii, Strain CCMP2513" /LENGTH=354 /DNA_ID=CAMNT_0013271583 /DNA_START=85 /DNA_END=1149 /DNA_ORIENTATION=+
MTSTANINQPNSGSAQATPSNNLYGDDVSIDSNFDPEIPTISSGNANNNLGISATLETEQYDAATIRAEFKTYQSVLPHPDKLLQEQHSFQLLRSKIEQSNIELPRFLKYKFEGGIKPHHALCCLLLSEYVLEGEKATAIGRRKICYPLLVRIFSFGYLHRQLNNPAEFIRDQFNRVAHAIPTDVVKPSVLRKKIKDRGLPVPNYFLDPEDDKQFPPHIALLVILQDGEKESGKLNNILYHLAFSLFAFIALLLRIVLEVIGGAGAIWGGAEVFKLRVAENAELWRWISIAVGILCFLRFVTLNAPQKEDEGDILGPAGPWSLRLPVRLRAVCDHPFHYFVRALPPSSPRKKKD